MNTVLKTDRVPEEVYESKRLNKLGESNMTAAEITTFNENGGAYRHTDMNRVGAACAEIYALLNDAGYAVTGYVALPTNWTRTVKPTKAQLDTYIATVAAIKASLPTETPVPSTWKRMTTEDANNIEKMLIEIDEILARLQSIYLRSGVFNSGYQFYAMEATT